MIRKKQPWKERKLKIMGCPEVKSRKCFNKEKVSGSLCTVMPIVNIDEGSEQTTVLNNTEFIGHLKKEILLWNDEGIAFL